jgi:cytoskeleton protein RodZ
MPDTAADNSLLFGSTDLTGAARVGANLREVRERLGWKLPDVAAQLRIRLPYLEAIERGELSALPGPAYQTGFVRSYALVLGLDPEEILRRFRAEGFGVAKKAELSFLAPVPDRAVPTGALVLLLVVVGAVGYGLYYWHSAHERRLAAFVPPVPVELAPLALPKLVPAPATVAPKPAAAPPVAAALPVAAPKPVVAAAPPAPPPAPVRTLVTTADSWIEVKDSTGTVLLSRVLHAGESWPIPAGTPGLVMTAGNAGATAIAVDGKPGAPLGAPGVVLHGYDLTPAAPATAKPTGPAKP